NRRPAHVPATAERNDLQLLEAERRPRPPRAPLLQRRRRRARAEVGTGAGRERRRNDARLVPAGRDLLGDAVDVAAAEEDLAGGDADDLAVGEGGGEDRGRLVVAGRVEQREDDPRVGDVEVDVAGGEAVAGAARLRALDDLDACRLLGGRGQRARG